jgi:ubiquinone/menaquinone biosynthesis C-methylase UbiE
MAEAGGLDPHILAHYEQHYREEERLGRESGRLEFLRTCELLNRFLPDPPGVVIDVGGGTGAYSLLLARAGYEVHFLDPVPRHVELVREMREAHTLASVNLGDAREIAFPDGAAHAVLCLGPLYHLTARPERLRALTEARRVLRSGGLVFAAAISRFASTYDGLFHGFMDEPEFQAIAARDVREGQHRNPTNRPEWFTTAFFHHPDELGDEIRDGGFELTGLFAVEGPGWFVPDLEDRLNDDRKREVLMEAIRRVEQEPSILGASPHLLAVGRR